MSEPAVKDRDKKIVPVLFNRSWGSYNQDERAGFGPQKAGELVATGWARYADDADLSDVDKITAPGEPGEPNPDATPLATLDIRSDILEVLNEAGFYNVEDVRTASFQELVDLPKIGEATARKLMEQVQG